MNVFQKKKLIAKFPLYVNHLWKNNRYSSSEVELLLSRQFKTVQNTTPYELLL